jgi:uncharacterized protein (DUF2141 family)
MLRNRYDWQNLSNSTRFFSVGLTVSRPPKGWYFYYMTRNWPRSALISLLACFVACDSGCSPKAGQENSVEKDNPTLESARNKKKAFSTPSDAISHDPHVEASSNQNTSKDPERKLRISVRGFASKTGNCRIVVYSDATSFNQPEKAALRAILPIEGGAASWEPSEEEMMKLPAQVAIAAFQDANENEKLDKNSLGIPTERYGFSNNPKRAFGPPSFHQAKFTLSDGVNALDIEIR